MKNFNSRKNKVLAGLLALLLCLPVFPLCAAASEEPLAETADEVTPTDDLYAPDAISDESIDSPNEAIEEPPVAAEDEAAAALDGDSYYTINGVTVTRTSSSITNNCFTYATEIYKKIWGTGFSSTPGTSDDLLRNISSAEARKLTAENVKNYITAAALGAVIRITGSGYLNTSSDAVGHSQLLVQKDSSGFTVLESNVTGGSREKYYTWAGYVSWWQQTPNRDYFKYIKWPGAPAYGGGGSTSPTPVEETCSCTDENAGFYICTASGSLNIRSGHGTSYSVIGSIPKGEMVYISMENGSWAHVEYNGITGYASMGYLTRYVAPEPIAAPEAIEDLNGDQRFDQIDAAMYLARGKTYFAALLLRSSVGIYD